MRVPRSTDWRFWIIFSVSLIIGILGVIIGYVGGDLKTILMFGLLVTYALGVMSGKMLEKARHNTRTCHILRS
jgi:hypothetical protein